MRKTTQGWKQTTCNNVCYIGFDVTDHSELSAAQYGSKAPTYTFFLKNQVIVPLRTNRLLVYILYFLSIVLNPHKQINKHVCLHWHRDLLRNEVTYIIYLFGQVVQAPWIYWETQHAGNTVCYGPGRRVRQRAVGVVWEGDSFTDTSRMMHYVLMTCRQVIIVVDNNRSVDPCPGPWDDPNGSVETENFPHLMSAARLRS